MAGDVFKCTADGQTQYQSVPCEAKVLSRQLQSESRSSLLGCYVTPIKGLEEGVLVRRGSKSPYEMVVSEGKDVAALPMKVATTEERLEIGTAFGITVDEGVSMQWTPGTPNQKPVGIYKGRDKAGKEVLLAYLFFNSGFVSKSVCK